MRALPTDGVGDFDFTFVANYNETTVSRTPTTAQLAALNPAPELFGRINVLTFEKGNPKDKLGAIVNWSHEQFGVTLRATRYGEVLTPGTTAATDFVLEPKVLVDLEGRVDLNDNWRLSMGVDNLFDQYPDPFPIALNTTGNTSFSNYSPYGRSGRFVFAKVSYNL